MRSKNMQGDAMPGNTRGMSEAVVNRGFANAKEPQRSVRVLLRWYNRSLLTHYYLSFHVINIVTVKRF